MSKALENSPSLTTGLNTYSFNISNPEDRAKYEALHAELSKTRELFATIGGERSKIVNGMVQLETRHVFDNQWNTTDDSETNPKMRVFDWAESIQPNRSIKHGHYLTISYEMIEIRKDVAKCGYCGSMHWLNHGLVFCDQCLNSEYLEEKQLHLLRLRPISESKGDMPPLTTTQQRTLSQAYVQAQTGNVLATEKKQREELDAEYKKSVNEAETKHDGFTWLLDNSVNIQNCIYYSHLNSFCFGWKQPLSESVREVLLKVLSEFPQPYTIKCDDGTTLEHK